MLFLGFKSVETYEFHFILCRNVSTSPVYSVLYLMTHVAVISVTSLEMTNVSYQNIQNDITNNTASFNMHWYSYPTVEIRQF